MKKYLYPVLAIIVIVLVIALLAYKKKEAAVAPVITPATDTSDTSTTTGSKTSSTSSPAPLRLEPGRKASTTMLAVGQKIVVTVINPTDAGYTLDPVAYQTSILALSSFTKAPAPKNAATSGAQGTATYEFTAIKPGTTSIAITASRTGYPQMSLFTNVVSVK